ncbi:MAG: hypothetical protein ACYC3F_15385 [Gemmatimonadaceae bacterium]
MTTRPATTHTPLAVLGSMGIPALVVIRKLNAIADGPLHPANPDLT